MGYFSNNFRRKPFNFMIGSSIVEKIDVNTVAATQTLGEIALPDFNGECLYAYIEFRFVNPYASAAQTKVDGDQYIEVSNDGGTSWNNAMKIDDHSFRIISNTTFTTNFAYVSGIDISDYVESGGTLNFRWKDAKSETGNLDLYTVQVVLMLVIA